MSPSCWQFAAVLALLHLSGRSASSSYVPAGTLFDLIAANPSYSLTTAAFSNISIVGDTLFAFYRAPNVRYTIFVANDAAWEATARLTGLPNGKALLNDPRLQGVLNTQVLL